MAFPPWGNQPAIRSATLLAKNAGTYYRGANKVLQAARDGGEGIDAALVEEAEMKGGVAGQLVERSDGDVVKMRDLFVERNRWDFERLVGEMVEEGLLGIEDGWSVGEGVHGGYSAGVGEGGRA
jgi:hypothetical protein